VCCGGLSAVSAEGATKECQGQLELNTKPQPPNINQPPIQRAHRDFGPRADRQKTRLIWCIEELGFEGFIAKVGAAGGAVGWLVALGWLVCAGV